MTANLYENSTLYLHKFFHKQSKYSKISICYLIIMIKPSINQPFYKHRACLAITGFLSSDSRSVGHTSEREHCYKSDF